MVDLYICFNYLSLPLNPLIYIYNTNIQSLINLAKNFGVGHISDTDDLIILKR